MQNCEHHQVLAVSPHNVHNSPRSQFCSFIHPYSSNERGRQQAICSDSQRPLGRETVLDQGLWAEKAELSQVLVQVSLPFTYGTLLCITTDTHSTLIHGVMQKSLTWIGYSFEQGLQFEFEIMVLEYALTFWQSHSSWAV